MWGIKEKSKQSEFRRNASSSSKCMFYFYTGSTKVIFTSHHTLWRLISGKKERKYLLKMLKSSSSDPLAFQPPNPFLIMQLPWPMILNVENQPFSIWEKHYFKKWKNKEKEKKSYSFVFSFAFFLYFIFILFFRDLYFCISMLFLRREEKFYNALQFTLKALLFEYVCIFLLLGLWFPMVFGIFFSINCYLNYLDCYVHNNAVIEILKTDVNMLNRG